MPATKKPARSATSKVFTAEEKAAMKELIRERKASGNKAEAEADGPCRDFNYDPTILPSGIAVSDDPLLAARSAAYAKSFDLRTAEAADYPYTPRLAGDRP